jgi:hypothetical protein
MANALASGHGQGDGKALAGALTGAPALLAWLCAATAGLGCNAPANDCPADGAYIAPEVQCVPQGSATVATADGFSLPATAQVASGQTCMTVDGICGGSAMFVFQTARDQDDHELNFGMQILRDAMPGPYSLPDSTGTINLFGAVAGAPDDATVHATSGTLIMTRNDEHAFQATFDVVLQTASSQQQVTVSGGHIDMGGCEIQNVCVVPNGWIFP